MNYLRISENEFSIVKGSPRTLFLYNQSFDRDLLSDLNEIYSGKEIINSSLAAKVLWCLCYTANDKELPYEIWIKLVDYKFDNNWKYVLINECNRAFEITVEDSVTLDENKKKSRPLTAREVAITILVNSKRMGLSFDELDTLTMNDYIDFSEMYSGNNRPRKATQVDIDNLFL